ncbi:hypothetical protein [Streptomyces sp. NBC_00448]|uniref:hypothetical protein n=1 Tax=Streptomyces sp. NBC_00448 TaxID=2903652 RepID=UPI002E1B3CC6
MSSWLVTLASAAGGGVLAMAATTVTDHLRWKRDRAEQWSAKRFEAYREFMNVMHVQVGAARSLATTHGLLDGPPPVSEEEGVREIAESDRTLALAYETVQLLGNERTGSAAHAWRAAVWQLSDYARGELPAERNDWAVAYTTYREARDTFQAAVRGDLGIGGPGFQRRHQTTPAEPGGVRQTS